MVYLPNFGEEAFDAAIHVLQASSVEIERMASDASFGIGFGF